MKATVLNKRGVTIVCFDGFLNFSHPQQIKEQLKLIYRKKRNRRIIFNLERLEFIGSSGIKSLIGVFKEFHASKGALRFYGLSPEFKRLFEALEGERKLKVFDNEKDAVKSYRIVRKAARA